VAGTLAITGADGKFSLPAPAALPFDLRVGGLFTLTNQLSLPSDTPMAAAPRRVGMLFQGVDRLDPTLMLPIAGNPASPGSRLQAGLECTVSGLGQPALTNSGILISPLGARGFSLSSTPATYLSTASWIPSSPADTSRSAAVSLFFIDSSGVVAVGKSAEVVFQAGQLAASGPSIVTAAPTFSPLSATVSAPGAFLSAAATSLLVFGDTTYPFPMGGGNAQLSGATPISASIPNMEGAKWDLILSAKSVLTAGGITFPDPNPRTTRAILRDLTPGATATSVALPEAPAPLEPVNNSTGPVAGTTFRVQQPEDRVRVYVFEYDDVDLFVLSAEKHIVFPDAAPLSIAAPASGTRVLWAVKSYTAPTVSAALGPNGYTSTLPNRSGVQPGEVFVEAGSETFRLYAQ